MTKTTSTSQTHEFLPSGCRYQWAADHDQADCWKAFCAENTRRSGRDFVRDIPGGMTSGGYPLVLHLAGRDDVSPEHRTYPTGYDSRCGLCWVNAPHTVDAHAVRTS